MEKDGSLRSSRRALYQAELLALQADIRRCGAANEASTGNAEADRLIRLWAPELED